MAKRSTTPTEESALAKWIVDHITIETKARGQKNPSTVRLGGPKGGKARAKVRQGRKSALVQKRRI